MAVEPAGEKTIGVDVVTVGEPLGPVVVPTIGWPAKVAKVMLESSVASNAMVVFTNALPSWPQ